MKWQQKKTKIWNTKFTAVLELISKNHGRLSDPISKENIWSNSCAIKSSHITIWWMSSWSERLICSIPWKSHPTKTMTKRHTNTVWKSKSHLRICICLDRKSTKILAQPKSSFRKKRDCVISHMRLWWRWIWISSILSADPEQTANNKWRRTTKCFPKSKSGKCQSCWNHVSVYWRNISTWTTTSQVNAPTTLEVTSSSTEVKKPFLDRSAPQRIGCYAIMCQRTTTNGDMLPKSSRFPIQSVFPRSKSIWWSSQNKTVSVIRSSFKSPEWNSQSLYSSSFAHLAFYLTGKFANTLSIILTEAPTAAVAAAVATKPKKLARNY